MDNIIGFYKSTLDIGNHESHYKKIGNFTQGQSVVVRFVSGATPTVEYEGDILKLEPGMILGENALVRSETGRVELSDIAGNVWRLEKRSQFCLETTIKGVIPVFYGNIHYEQIYPSNGIFKARASCYHTNSTVTVEICGTDKDCYYSYDVPVEIFEFDEQGKRFSLMYLEPFQKGVLAFDFNKPMRERYSVVEISDLTKDECVHLYDSYKLPFNWDERWSKVSNSDDQVV